MIRRLTRLRHSLATLGALALGLALPGTTVAQDITPLGHVERRGEGPVHVILIPGLSCDWEVWKPFIERNRTHYTMHAVTLPGMGDTDAPPIPDGADTPWLDNAVAAVAAYVKTAALDQPFVIGHSLGGFTAYRLGIEHGDLFAGIIAVDGMPAFPIGPMEMPADQRRQMVDQMLRPQLRAIDDAQWFAQQDMYASNMSSDPEVVEHLKIMFRRTPAAHAVQYMIELAASDIRDQMKNMKSRGLAIAAINDDGAAMGVDAAALRERWDAQTSAMPEGALVCFNDSRHWLMDERADAFDAVVAAFIRGDDVPAEVDPPGSDGAIRVERLDDLPRHTYPMDVSATDLLTDDQRFATLAAAVRTDIENDLKTYDIQDRPTLTGMKGVLLSLDLLERRSDAVLTRIEELRALETKESKQLTTGLSARAIATTWNELGADTDLTDPAFRDAFRDRLEASISALPWSVVGDEIESTKGTMEIITENVIRGILQGSIDPVVARSGEASADIAHTIIGMKATIDVQLQLRDIIIDVYAAAIAENHVEKADIWAQRNVTIEGDDLDPVIIAVWDSGIDTPIFDGMLWTNEEEVIDGIDNDGNGFVDDRHGIAHDIKANRVPEMLLPLDDLSRPADEVKRQLKGYTDVQASVNSADANELKQHLAGLEPYEIRAFVEDLNLYAGYAHGTHVAGIAVAGNPSARVMVSRLSFDHRMIPDAPTVEQAGKDAQAMIDTIEYFVDHNVRIVNMSWGGSRADIESALEANGVGASTEERAELARTIYRIGRDALHDAIRDAEDILFICAAGNSDNDVEFDEMMPSGFNLPNLMVVGAVDQAGEPTSFTSFGRTVDVYANGFEVDSYVPGGERMAMSGTSMASPNAANLAGKILTLRPDLTPAQVIALVRDSSDRIQGDHPFLLMNPKRAIEMLRNER